MTALALATDLLDLLRRAADDAEALAAPLRALDSATLLEWAEQRQAVRDHAAYLEQRLLAAQGDGPRDAEVAAVLAAVRAEASRLQRIDADNADRVGRTLRVVRGFASALAPAPEAYDRSGRARRGAP